MSQAEIVEATTTEEYVVGKTLIEEYASALGVDLYFQNFSEEISNLRKIYAPPHGCLFLARANGKTVGCVAVRNQAGATCEMKRLYVKPPHRGAGLGRRLVEIAIWKAQQLGYTKMLLDTLPSMTEAQSLYESIGFREVEFYYPNPVQGVRYFGRGLTNSEKNTA
jgi:ribosomal protein S18 acetylase RimI-like enzyme